MMTCCSTSDMHAALDASNADRTLAKTHQCVGMRHRGVSSRPDTVDLLIHLDMLFSERRVSPAPIFVNMAECIPVSSWICRPVRRDPDIPELPECKPPSHSDPLDRQPIWTHFVDHVAL